LSIPEKRKTILNNADIGTGTRLERPPEIAKKQRTGRDRTDRLKTSEVKVLRLQNVRQNRSKKNRTVKKGGKRSGKFSATGEAKTAGL